MGKGVIFWEADLNPNEASTFWGKAYTLNANKFSGLLFSECLRLFLMSIFEN